MEVEVKTTKKRNFFVNLLMSPEVGILIPLIILCGITTSGNPLFLTFNNFSVILIYATYMGIISIGQGVVIMSGEIDLSVGLNACFSGIVFGYFTAVLQANPIICILAGIIAGVLIGTLNGYLVAKFGLVNFVTTLATMFLCWGLAVTISGGRPLLPFPMYYIEYSMAKPLGLSYSFFILLAIFIIMEIVIRYTTVGRRFKAVGGNKEAALMAGIDVVKVKWGAYILSGSFAAISGMLAAISMNAASPDFGIGLEFRTITACAVGGISFAGGSGSILGVGIGILFVNILNNCLQLLRVESNWQLVIIGFVLVISVILDNLKKEIQARRV